MGVLKIFPEKTATIYSQYPFLNTGYDEVLGISNLRNITTSSQGISEVSRTLIQFLSSSISGTLASIGNTNYKVYLKLFLANASSIPLNFTLICNPISGSWDVGSGRYDNTPQTQDGVSWKYRTSTILWQTGSFINASTGSFSTSNPGGGSWYTSSLMQSSQSFSNISSKDIELDVTNIITSFYSSSLGIVGAIPNNGLILRNSSQIEFGTASLFDLRYFSGVTHTIYPPQLEFRYNDHSFNTGSKIVASSDQIEVTLANNKNEFQENSIQKFVINVRDKYPTRQFTTSSIYLNSKVLPSQSFWAIKDAHTEEMVVDFDSNYTNINCDGTSSYVNINMGYLEPERNYSLLIKTVIGNETLIFDKKYFFKIIR